MKKILVSCLLVLGFLILPILGHAENYIFFYGNGCSHCANVEEFFTKNQIEKKFTIDAKEVYADRENLKIFNDYVQKLGLDQNTVGVPFMVIQSGSELSYLKGDEPIIQHFENKIKTLAPTNTQIETGNATCGVSGQNNSCGTGQKIQGNIKSESFARLSFFGIMLPAAISDSINPCAFAVMLLLLSTILSKHKSRKKTLIAGGMFALAVFLSYLGMGIGLFSALASTTNTLILKLIVGILGILVGLANIKDFFRYGKIFVMEVPFSWRPKMMNLIEKVSSPWGAFVVGVLVSLFLLPCSSGPYFTILGYLSSESKTLTSRGYIYLIIYNLIFVLPMVIIAILVSSGYATVDKLAKLKSKNTKIIHLIVGLLMLGLGVYVLATM